jgi:AAA domain
MPELLAMGGEITWRAKGLIVHPTHGMVAGEQKTLKTYVEMFMDIAIAAGVPIFDRFDVIEPCPVVSYVGEGGRVPHTKRLQRVAEAVGVNLADIPLFTSYDVAPIDSDRFQQSLERDLHDHQPGEVGIDPYYAFHGTTIDPRSLHAEGALLASLSGRCADAGAGLRIVNHYNQTGTGRGLHRITMAGGAEWCDSWWLLSHREPADVPAGRFQLLLEVGSRQWGGGEWDLDLNLGPFNLDTLDYDNPITYEVTSHHRTSSETGIDDETIQILVDMPWQLTRSQLIDKLGGNIDRARGSVDRLEKQGRIRHARVERIEGSRRVHRDLYAMFSEPISEAPE